MQKMKIDKAQFHLPGLFEFYEFYKVFLPLYEQKRYYFYDWVNIASIYGAPSDCLWSGGRFGYGEYETEEVLGLLQRLGISARLTFSNSLLKEEHLMDEKCNTICKCLAENNKVQNGVIVHSELLLSYLKRTYPELYLVSSTTKVLTEYEDLHKEIQREEFQYVVPDFRWNMKWEQLGSLSQEEKNKVEFLCNEGCYVCCQDRKECYEAVSRKILDENSEVHICNSPHAKEGYLFSRAMKSPTFIGIEDITQKFLPNGFSNFKIEGRNLGSALLLEFLLYYLTKTEHQLEVREQIYLDSMLDLF